jgi:hypothetical protein
MRLEAAAIPASDRQALEGALVSRFRDILSADFDGAQGYHHGLEREDPVPKGRSSPGKPGAVRLGVSRGSLWGLRVTVRPGTEPKGSISVVVRESIPLFEKLKKGVLIFAFVAAFGIGIVSLIAGLVEGFKPGDRGLARKGIVMTSVLFGALSGLAAGVGGLFLLSPVHLLCRSRLRGTVRETAVKFRDAIRAETESLKREIPVNTSGSASGCLFSGAALFGAGFVASVFRAGAAVEDGPKALWILSCVGTGLVLLLLLGGHLAEEYGFND